MSKGALQYDAQRMSLVVGLLVAVIGCGPDGRHIRYLHGDRLASVDTVTGESGAVLERHGYDAFGKPLTSDWEDAGGLLHNGEYPVATTTRGFTSHEHLDAHGLIHMNGRVYDPALGRFLSVDPFIQSPGNSQNLNPYSYVLNNPLSGVDPTGYQCEAADRGTSACIDPGGELPVPPLVLDPGVTNGQAGQGVDLPSRGPAADHGRAAFPDKCGAADLCIKFPPDSDPPPVKPPPPIRPPAPPAPAPPPSSGSWLSRAVAKVSKVFDSVPRVLNWVQTGLDSASLFLDATVAGASVSWIPDLVNAGISLARGDTGGALLSAMAAVPGIGAPANLAHMSRTAAKLAGETAGAALTTRKAAKGTANGKRAGKPHTPAAKRLDRQRNLNMNNGEMVCPRCGTTMVEPTRRTKGSTVNPNEAQGDHIYPRSKGGDGATIDDVRNIETICASCNNKKSNRIE